MGYPVTLNGRTYTLADFEGNNYVDGLPDAFEDFVTHAGDIYNDTSTTSNSIGTGSKTFTVSSGKPYQGSGLPLARLARPIADAWMCCRPGAIYILPTRFPYRPALPMHRA